MTRTPGAALGRAPLRLLVPAVLAVLFLVLPMAALLLRVPWPDLAPRLLEPEVLDALRLSLVTSLAAVAVVTAVGIPLSWLLARVDFPGRSVLRALVIVPLVLPPVVAGVALLSAFGRRGLVGGPLYDAFGITLPFTTARGRDRPRLRLAAVLRAQRRGSAAGDQHRVRRRGGDARREPVDDVPARDAAARGPGVLAGLVLSWARALGEFGATITFAGNYPGTTRTMPNAIYVALQADQDAAVVLSVVLMVVSVAALALMRERWFDQAIRGGGPR